MSVDVLVNELPRVLATGGERDHIVLWHRSDAARDAVVGEFVEAGGRNGEFIAIALCLGDFEGLERSLSKRLHTIESLIASGDLVMFVSCEFLPRKDGMHKVRARESFAEIEEKARSGRRGLRMIGTVPFAILAAGDFDECMAMERLGAESLERGRLLCLYDMRMLKKVGLEKKAKINEAHTHVLVEDKKGRIVLSPKRPKKP